MLIVSIMFGGKLKSGGGHEWNIFNKISVKKSTFFSTLSFKLKVRTKKSLNSQKIMFKLEAAKW